MLPLSGMRVIAIEQYGAGPYGTMQLADLGAEVIKIENPADGGDMGRRVGPFFLGPDDSHFFESFNRNKKSITLDLKGDGARDVLFALVRDADGLLNNLRGDLAETLGLTYDALKEANPRIVCAHLSAYGRTGPRANWPGYDYLMQAEAGYLSLTGEPEGPPSRMGLSVVDMMTGLFAAFALLSGIIAARQSGQGRDIDVSLFDCALQNLNYLATWYLNEGHKQGREPRSSHPSLTPSQLYRTRDGYIFVMCNKEKFWPVLCDMIGRPDLAAHPDFRTFKDRLANRQKVTALLDAALSERTTAEWLERFRWARSGRAGQRHRRRARQSLRARWRANLERHASGARGFQNGRGAIYLPGRRTAPEPCPGARSRHGSGLGRMRAVAGMHRNAASARRYLSAFPAG